MNRFDADTAVEPLGDGRFRARIDPGWWIAAGPNGGYVAAILLRAFERAVDDPARAPRSLTVHYTAPPAAGPALVETRVERCGRSLTALSARLLQDDRVCALALAAFSRPREAHAFCEARMPEVAPPERCPAPPRPVEIAHRYDTRWAIGSLPFSGGDRALCGGWIRLAEPRAVDAPLLAAYADALPPAIFSRSSERDLAGGVPTVDLSVHFRASLPLEGARPDAFCLAVFRTQVAREGFLEEDGEIWSPGGVLLAQSRQLAVIAGPGARTRESTTADNPASPASPARPGP